MRKKSIDNLVEEARKLGRHRTKSETIRAALDEYVQKRKRKRVIELFGTIDYDEEYNYKRQRKLKY